MHPQGAHKKAPQTSRRGTGIIAPRDLPAGQLNRRRSATTEWRFLYTDIHTGAPVLAGWWGGLERMLSISSRNLCTLAGGAVLAATLAAVLGCRCDASEQAIEPHSPAPRQPPATAATAAPAATLPPFAGLAPSPGPTTGSRPPRVPPATPPATRPPTAPWIRPEGAADRYAVTVHTDDRDDLGWFLGELGVEWYLHNDYRVDNIPPGHRKLLYVGSLPGPDASAIQRIAGSVPGATWLILNEPNRRGGHAPSDIVEELHRLYTAIRSADPGATILSPSILNWEFTCTLCRGYQPGRDWLAEFRAAYLDRYGTEPPVDAWAVNVYPLDWMHVPTVDLDLAIAQIEGLRRYLDGVPELAGQPIWIPEIGLHWGWDAIDWTAAPCVRGAGEYQTARVVAYLRELFDWLDRNGERLTIEKMFVYISHRDITTCNEDYYAGITLFDGPLPGASLTPAGEALRERTPGHWK